MNYVNPAAEMQPNVFHKTFSSILYGHELGYNIYLPLDYEHSDERYPVVYHLHGWTDNESSHIGVMSDIYAARRAITVFPNSSPVIEDRENLPVEEMLISELIPLIDTNFRTVPTREGRALSGFSMGGGFAFYLAVKYPELFSSVTAYAGTYHHYFSTGLATVGADPVSAPDFYRTMMQDVPFDRSILQLVSKNAAQIRGQLEIRLHIGTEDVLYCDNEIMRLHLEVLDIPFRYKTFPGASHRLADIL